MAKKKEKKKTLKKEEQEQVQDVMEAQENEETLEQEDVKEEELSIEEKLTIELAEAKDKYLRLYSEFENFRRRTAKERLELTKSANSDLMVDLLPVIDDFERANTANETQDDIEAVKEGFGLINHKFFKVLEQRGLKPMDTSKGSSFDADLHEAIAQFPAEEEGLKGQIIDTVEKGYYLGDKVVRFAKVVLAS